MSEFKKPLHNLKKKHDQKSLSDHSHEIFEEMWIIISISNYANAYFKFC